MASVVYCSHALPDDGPSTPRRSWLLIGFESLHSRLRITAAVSLLLTMLVCPPTAPAYSVQTHEQLIDLTWKSSIRPLLLARYPGLTEAQLKEAHAYAYGGCAIQDLGYYPFGHMFFSDLTHYVRSGDFIRSLLRNAHTADELAFAIGALSHYIGDTEGHSEAINLAVPDEFPRLRERYGPVVAYDQDPHAHVRTEFAFDINEISKHRFAPLAYQRHIGLDIPDRLLRRAFYETYGLDEQQVIGRHRPVLRAYRFAVHSFIPRIAYAETLLHRNSMPPDTSGQPLDTLNAVLVQARLENAWQPYRKRAGIGTHLLAWTIVIVPKVGTLSDLAIKGPAPETEGEYVRSVLRSITLLSQALGQLGTVQESIPNLDLDTGAKVRPGGYRLTDQTYAALLGRITAQPERVIPSGLKDDIAGYYADPTAPITTRNHPAQWAKVQHDLVVLLAMKTRPEL
jgi:hypothetical protein